MSASKVASRHPLPEWVRAVTELARIVLETLHNPLQIAPEMSVRAMEQTPPQMKATTSLGR